MMFMKVVCLIFSLLFACFSYWQLNDMTEYQSGKLPTILWVLGYAATAMISFLCIFRQLPTKFFALLILLTATLAAFRFPQIPWESGKNPLFHPDNPAANETGGFLVLCSWFIALLFFAPKHSHRETIDKDIFETDC